VTADQVRHRRDVPAIDAVGEIDADIRLLVARRRELVGDQMRRISRLARPAGLDLPRAWNA
jgi:hypothetical protein